MQKILARVPVYPFHELFADNDQTEPAGEKKRRALGSDWRNEADGGLTEWLALGNEWSAGGKEAHPHSGRSPDVPCRLDSR
jgi:hypothetical protein